MNEHFAFWFAWVNLIATTILWPIVQLTNKTEPAIVLALSFYAIWQGSLIYLVTAHVDKKRKEDDAG